MTKKLVSYDDATSSLPAVVMASLNSTLVTKQQGTRAAVRVVPRNENWGITTMPTPPTTMFYQWNVASDTVLAPRTEYAYNDFSIVSPLNAVIETITVNGPGAGSTNKSGGDFGVPPWSIEFDHYGDTFVLRYRAWVANQAKIHIFVDGLAVTAAPVTQAAAAEIAAVYSYKVQFASVAMRRVRVFYELADHYGFWLPPTQTAAPTATRRLRIACVGDSWMDGTGATYNLTAWMWQLGRYLNADVFQAGQGGTGYSFQGGAGRQVFGDNGRTNRLVTANPDMVLVFGSINDDNQPTLQADATAYYAKLATLLPGVPVVVVGVQGLAGSPNTARLANSTAVKNAALAAPNVVKVVDPIAEDWITGTGVKNTPTGDGNADYFMGGSDGSDGTHPTQAGHDYLARKMARVLSDVL